MTKFIIFSFLLCSFFAHAPYEEIAHCQSSYEYDVAGNPDACNIVTAVPYGNIK